MLHVSDGSATAVDALPTVQRLVHISHAPQDEAWVRGVVIPALGLVEGQYWTRAEDHPGAPKIRELERAVQSCRYTLLIASSAARVDEWTTFAGILAQHLGIEEGKPRLIIITRDFEPGSERARALLPLRHRCLVLLDGSDSQTSAASLAMLAARLALTTVEEPLAECPYPGLRMFGTETSDGCFNRTDLFFGRDDEARAVIGELRRYGRALVVGPSGCGKSSLVRARVLPAMAEAAEFVAAAVVRPGQAPDLALRSALDALDPQLCLETDTHASIRGIGLSRVSVDGARVVIRLIYIDQFEEVFLDDSAAGHEERARFFARLAALRKVHGVAVLLSMRADFYADLMRSPAWNDYKEHRIELTPLRGSALRQAIVRPAETVGVYIEVDLVERLVREAELDRAAEALPLLQVALEQLWAHREWRYLSLASYERISDSERRGLDAVLGRHADAAIDSLTPAMRVLARRVLTDLVHLGDGRPDTRRRRSVKELSRADDNLDLMTGLLQHLLASRLIAVGASALSSGRRAGCKGMVFSDEPVRHIDLAHDTLITGWPALAGWINERRDKLQTQRRLEARASGGGLLAASELPEFIQWITWAATPAGKELGVSEILRNLVRRSVKARTRLRVGIAIIMILLASAAGLAYRQRGIAVDYAELADLRAREADLARKEAQEQSHRAIEEANQVRAEQDARSRAEAEAQVQRNAAERAVFQAKQETEAAARASAHAQVAKKRADDATHAEQVVRKENEAHQQKEQERLKQRQEMNKKIIIELPE